MTEPPTFNEHAERLKIRSAPKAVTRINRKLLLVGAALGALALFAAAHIALSPPRAIDQQSARELINTKNARRPEGLASLPVSYDDVPRLGPPLPGDLGSTILEAERDLGLQPEYATRFDEDFRPNPEDDAARGRRMREAALIEEAANAPVFFRLQSETRGASIDPSSERPSLPGVGSELMALASRQPGALTATQDANYQDRKIAFAGEPGAADIYNQYGVQDAVSPYQVMAGTIIAASLVTGLNSDLPGTIIAQVTQPVFDTVTGMHLLIPQGSRLLGRYQSEVSFGQSRALIVWDRLIFPDGSSIVISAPGADARGFAGLSDRTDHHWDRVFVAAGLATILGIGAELGAGNDEDEIVRAIRRGASGTVNQAGQRVVERNLNVQPTITVRPGWPVRVIVTRDLILRPH